MRVTLVTVGDSVRARIGTWPYEPDVAHIVLLDHQMVPNAAAVERWVAEAKLRSPRKIRTGALFPQAVEAFAEAGFCSIDTLVLLEAALDPSTARADRRRRRRQDGRIATQRMRSGRIEDVAALDRTAFGDPWGNDERSLRDVMRATPRHRSRVVRNAANIVGFAIAGHAGTVGYLQRLAVHPDARRSGIALGLVRDATEWMCRRGATTAMVNTAANNAGALALYEHAGFRSRSETLSILELDLP